MRRFVALGALSLAACSSAATPRPTVAAPAEARLDLGPPVTWSGQITYESRSPTPHGASLAVTPRPARFVELRAVGPAGVSLGQSRTDAEGRYVLTAPSRAAIEVVARLADQTVQLSVTGDADGVTPHSFRVPTVPPAGGALDVRLPDDPAGVAGAFHILDTVLRGLDAAHRWSGVTLPPLSVYWGRGVTTEWSFYRGERPAGSGRYVLELLGGRRNRTTEDDCDEHDEGIILHEVGHFVMDMLSSNSSTGGSHPSGYLVDPGLAWEEGRATWFSAAVRGAPDYQDTIGREPQGSLRVNHDLEGRGRPPRGIGSEDSVANVLWDLSDGVEGQPDTDHDGIALGPEAVLRAMMADRNDPAAFPSLGGFLRRISEPAAGGAQPLVARAALLAMLDATGEPATLVPTQDADDWPTNLAAPGVTTGKIDGLTNPAPSGGPARAENGFDAVRMYRVHATERGWLFVELNISGMGSRRDRSDLDLELRDHRAEVLSSSRGTAPRETVGRLVEPGYYYVYVRDGGGGNRANFELRTRFRPIPTTPSAAPAPVAAPAPAATP